MAVYILLGVLILIVSLLLVRIKLAVSYDETAAVYLKVLFFKVNIYPKKKKVPKLSKFSIEKVRKKNKKYRVKEKKKQSGISSKDAKTSRKRDVISSVKFAVSLVKSAVKPLYKYARVDFARIYVKVATEDAAKTAITFGVVSQLCAALWEFLKNFKPTKKSKPEEVKVFADFIDTKFEVKIKVEFSLRIVTLFALLFETVFSYLKELANKQLNKNQKVQKER